MSKSQEPGWIDTINTQERRILDLREIGMRHALALGRFHYVRASPPLEDQKHDSWLVLQFVLSGQQRLIVDGTEQLIRGGEMIRILPGQRYGTGEWHEQRGEMVWLILQSKPMPRGPALGMRGEGVRAVFTKLLDPLAATVAPMSKDAMDIIESVFEGWARREEDFGKEIIRNRISALVLGAAAVFSGSQEKSADQANERRMRKVIEWMTEHPEGAASSEELAEMAGLSCTRFHFHFKRVTGSSPRDYWLRLKIERTAKHLLEFPAQSVTDVAHEYGFSSSQYFATVFRRYMGVPPGDYRAKGGS